MSASSSASKMKGNLIYNEEAPTSFIISISSLLAKVVKRIVLPIKMKAAKAITIEKLEAATARVEVIISNLSIASPDALISLTAGFPSSRSMIKV